MDGEELGKLGEAAIVIPVPQEFVFTSWVATTLSSFAFANPRVENGNATFFAPREDSG